MQTRYVEMIKWGIIQLIICIVLILIYYFSCKFQNRKNKRLQKADYIILILMILISGLRCNSGSDYYNYYIQYINSVRWYDSIYQVLAERFQNGYMFLAYITRRFIGGKFSIFIIIAMISYFTIIKIIKKRSEYPWKSFSCWLLMGYFFMSMNIVKQFLSMTFIFWVYDSFYNKKYLKAVIFSIISCFFHISAIYCIVCIFLFTTIKKTKQLYCFVLFFSVIILCFIKYMSINLISFIPIRYYEYIYYLYNGDYDFKLQLGAMLILIFYVWLISIGIKNLKKLNNSYYRGIFNISICMLPFIFISIQLYISNRVAYFGLQMLPLVIPSLLKLYKKKNFEKLFIRILVVFSFLFSILCAENNYYHYGTIFNERPMSVKEYVDKNK